MAGISFSEFAKMLYPYCADRANQSDFVITLADKIMKGRPGRANGEDRHKNPLRDKTPDELSTYFNGRRLIPQPDAREILGSIDKYKFEQYINMCSEDALSLIESEFIKLLGTVTDKSDLDTAAKCADIFVEILQERASVDKTTG